MKGCKVQLVGCRVQGAGWGAQRSERREPGAGCVVLGRHIPTLLWGWSMPLGIPDVARRSLWINCSRRRSYVRIGTQLRKELVLLENITIERVAVSLRSKMFLLTNMQTP